MKGDRTHLSPAPGVNLAVGLRLCAGLVLIAIPLPIPPTGDCPCPRANFPAGELAKEGRNLIPSAIFASSGSSSSPANRGRVSAEEEARWWEGREGVWKGTCEVVEVVHQSDMMALTRVTDCIATERGGFEAKEFVGGNRILGVFDPPV